MNNSAETCAREFFEIEDAAHRSMQGSHGYTGQRNTRLAALIERERLMAKIETVEAQIDDTEPLYGLGIDERGLTEDSLKKELEYLRAQLAAHPRQGDGTNADAGVGE